MSNDDIECYSIQSVTKNGPRLPILPQSEGKEEIGETTANLKVSKGSEGRVRYNCIKLLVANNFFLKAKC